MIISHKYKFIFIKTVKTAGTSIEVFLSQHCGENDIFTPIVPPIEAHRPRNYQDGNFKNHTPARRLRNRLPRSVWDQYYKFCVERNPWDKVLSHYHMLRHRKNGELALEKYFSSGRNCLNFPKYTDKSGQVLVDRILRYENLDRELGEVFLRLGIPYKGVLDFFAKSDYRKDSRHYSEVLADSQAKVIEKKYKSEIDLLGYEFCNQSGR